MSQALFSAPASQALVICRIGAQDYALPLEATLRVVRLPALTILPDSKPEVCGLLNLNGRHLPVIDGRRLVGETPHYDLTNQIIIVNAGTNAADVPTLGLLVDEVYGLAHLSSGGIHMLNMPYAGRFFSGIVLLDHRSCLIFNVAELRRITA
ncbi:MAG: chemotaxis protein CheW [Roseiflexus sp.]|nr:chemotaxis protein CheW [Roseiflexus sp.]MCS7290891.1 chemotaxis protein CheW [Roseiflexus sp.]MDW8232729.1 chemotaxis protein CheW [Roseiflexaceae bacterium]